MTEPKFTPGPWYVYNNGFYLETTNESGQEAPTISISDIHDKNISNANLIAAAPEMLEKIQRLEAEKAESEHALGFAVEAVERLEAEKAEMGKVLLLVKVMIDSHAKHLTCGSGYHRLVEVIKNQGKARGEE